MCVYVESVCKAKITHGRNRLAWRYTKAKRKKSYLSVKILLILYTFRELYTYESSNLSRTGGFEILKNLSDDKKGEEKPEEQSLSALSAHYTA